MYREYERLALEARDLSEDVTKHGGIVTERSHSVAPSACVVTASVYFVTDFEQYQLKNIGRWSTFTMLGRYRSRS
jgi:hypothetical protein